MICWSAGAVKVGREEGRQGGREEGRKGEGRKGGRSNMGQGQR